MKVGSRLAALIATLVVLAGGALAQQATLDGRTLVVTTDGTSWRRTFPLALGTLVDPLVQGNVVWQAVGPQLYAFDLAGRAVARLDLPADATAIDGSGTDVNVTVRYGALQQTLGVSGLEFRDRVVYPPLEATTAVLERAARENLPFNPVQPADPERALAVLSERVSQDPTNPFHHAFLAVAALRAGQGDRALAAVEAALDRPAPFFVSIRLARFFDAAGLPAVADRALENARASWARLGHDPALPVSRAALSAYGDPLGYLTALLDRNQVVRAEAWLRFLRDIAPRFEGHRATYDRYIRLLDAQNRVGEAHEWRRFQRELAQGTLYTLGPDALLAVRDTTRWSTWALVVAIAAMAVALGARAWSTQGRDLAPLGGRYRSWVLHPLSRARRILLSYWGFGEKLVLVTLLLGLLVSLSAWSWSARTYERSRADVLNFGTLGGLWFYEGIDRLGLDPASPDARFLRGIAAQLDGDDAEARRHYTAAGRNPCALNNLGVLLETRGDSVTARERYRAALALAPDLTAPAYNLQLNPAGFEASFQRQYRAEPRLCFPDQTAVYRALDGGLSGEFGQILSNPWTYLTRFPSGLPSVVQWIWVAPLLLLTTVSALWLLVPRLGGRPERTPWRFRLLALLLPGVAFLDIAWGLVLLLTWSAVLVGGASALGWWEVPYLVNLGTGRVPALLGLLLLGCYALNTLLLVLAGLRALRAPRRAPRAIPEPRGRTTPGT